MRIKKRPMSIQIQTERNLVMATVEAEVLEGECRGIRGNMDTLLGVNQDAGKQGKQKATQQLGFPDLCNMS